MPFGVSSLPPQLSFGFRRDVAPRRLAGAFAGFWPGARRMPAGFGHCDCQRRCRIDDMRVTAHHNRRLLVGGILTHSAAPARFGDGHPLPHHGRLLQ
eukprot:CAMPEP_0117552174 /NCGR_PEP_ID=MMETSP0784-20121206/49571_1 /TAXON_ID=39447 /ORGANISM="" /LENGTH=96 /DNA_ID=CAMNT_0005349237 /DNA_START=103 /DNA_END=390 /DNA_ORIENTATION=-